MQKCPNCNEKTLELIEKSYLCSTCNYVRSNKDKLTTLKKITSKKDKDKKNEVEKFNIEKLQKQNTSKSYLRFRIFRIGE